MRKAGKINTLAEPNWFTILEGANDHESLVVDKKTLF
jgi:hypothetical protein